MKLEIRKKYLIFPVNTLSSVKVLSFCEDSAELYRLSIKLDDASPNFYAYVDVSRFIGKTLNLSITPDMKISFTESETMDLPDLYGETYRPQIHFTTKNGWLNDPNGLIYLDGQYHMFYQHNPCENRWGNMHWGHAVSCDMIHWEEKDIALFPDHTGAMFSGSAILDEKNLLGLGDDSTPTALLYYTATDPHMQYIAYSTDGFQSIQKLGKHVVPTLAKFDRDPKVIFCDEWDAYVMALYLEKDVYGLLRSRDLVKWQLMQRIALLGDNECPDLFPVVADDGQRRWVLMGAHGRYVVGEMQKNSFVPLQETLSLNYGGTAYAGQTFSHLPNGRIVRIDWDKWYLGTPGINGQMSIPYELTLALCDGTYRLCANPIKEMESLFDGNQTFEKVELKGKQAKRIELAPSAYMIKLKCEQKNAVLKMTLFGRTYTLDLGANQLNFGCDRTLPLSLSQSQVELTMIVDRCSAEMFLDRGKIYNGSVDEKTYSDYTLPYLEFLSDEDLVIENLQAIRLKSIWK